MFRQLGGNSRCAPLSRSPPQEQLPPWKRTRFIYIVHHSRVGWLYQAGGLVIRRGDALFLPTKKDEGRCCCRRTSSVFSDRLERSSRGGACWRKRAVYCPRGIRSRGLLALLCSMAADCLNHIKLHRSPQQEGSSVFCVSRVAICAVPTPRRPALAAAFIGRARKSEKPSGRPP